MSRGFRKADSTPRLSPEPAARQGRISRSAIARLGAPGAIAFLNRHDDGLGGRPLDRAIESMEGLQEAEALLGSLPPVCGS